MQALVKEEPAPGMTLQDVPKPEPRPEEARIRVESVGIDGGAEALIYQWDHGTERWRDQLPHIFGHECAGTVESVGDEVTRVGVGDRVAVEPGLNCGACRICRQGRPDICPNRATFGLHTHPGALADYAVLPAKNLYAIGESISFDEAVFLELVALAYNGLNQSQFAPGDDVLITGPGSVGLGVLVACRVSGANRVTMIGAPEDRGTRLPIAAEMGADDIYSIEDDFDVGPVDIAFEAAGHRSALDALIENTRNGGEIVQIGLFHGDDRIEFPANALTEGGIGYRPIRSRQYDNWRQAISAAHQVDLGPAIGPAYPMEAFEEAFAAFERREGVKVFIHP